MRKAKCEDGHFFDMDRYPVCPLCGKGGAALGEAPRKPAGTASGRKTEILWAAPEEPPAEIPPAPAPPERTARPAPAGASPTPAAGKPAPETAKPAPAAAKPAPAAAKPKPAKDTPGADAPAPAKGGSAKGASAKGASAKGTPGTDAPGTGSSATDAPAKGTPAPAAGTEGDELPAAWLVCLSPPYRGHPFPCRAGHTRIGRSGAVEIALPDAPSLSEEFHAAVIYEPIRREFFLEAGVGTGLTYRNATLVFSHDTLRPYDRVRLGKVEFVFLPLCGEHFSWED